MSAEISTHISDLETKDDEFVVSEEKENNDVEPVFSLDDDDKSSIITLITKGGHRLTITKQAAMISKLLSTIMAMDQNATEIPLPNVTKKTLLNIIEYANHHGGVAQEIVKMPLSHNKMIDNCTHKWDAEFIDRIGERSQRELYSLIISADYMDIKCLIHLGSAKMASWLRGVTLETIDARLTPRKDDVDPEDLHDPQQLPPSGSKNDDEKKVEATIIEQTEQTMTTASSIVEAVKMDLGLTTVTHEKIDDSPVGDRLVDDEPIPVTIHS